MAENDNDADTGTNTGRAKGGFLNSYFVRQVYVFRYPTAHSHPCKVLLCPRSITTIQPKNVSG
jgi:hypothetical protein